MPLKYINMYGESGESETKLGGQELDRSRKVIKSKYWEEASMWRIEDQVGELGKSCKQLRTRVMDKGNKR